MVPSQGQMDKNTAANVWKCSPHPRFGAAEVEWGKA